MRGTGCLTPFLRRRPAWLQNTFKGMRMLPCAFDHIRHLGLCNIVRIYPAGPGSLMMDLEHEPRRGLKVLAEDVHQDLNHELHRGMVVVQQAHFSL